MAKATYRLELSARFFSTLGLAVGVGGFCSYFARNGFGADGWMISAIVSAPALASMASSLLSSHLGSLKQSTVAGLGRIFGGLSIGAVALLTLGHPFSALAFTILSLLTATAMMVSTHAITQIWKANFPASKRGAIVSRIFIMQLSLTALLAWLAGRVLDARPHYFRPLFIAAAISWIISGLYYMRIPVRGDNKRIADNAGQTRNPFAPLGVLASDKDFARYQTLQMIQGMACLSLGPVWTLVLSDRFNLNYANAAASLMTIPFVMQVILIPFLGKRFDCMSLFRFRWFGSLAWSCCFIIMAVGIAWLSLPMVMVGFMLMGTGQSFGRLAWNMGHMDFGSSHQNLTYMSAHMMLTGFRGIIMPFLGMYLYQHVLGDAVFWIGGVMLICTAITFRLWDPHCGLKRVHTQPQS